MKEITKAEALKQGYDMCSAPGYNGEYDCVLIEDMSDEEIINYKPLVCEKEPLSIDEENEVVYYNRSNMLLIP